MARKEDADYDIVGLQRTSNFDPRSCGNVGENSATKLTLHYGRPTPDRSIGGPTSRLRTPPFYQLSASALAPTESVVFIMFY